MKEDTGKHHRDMEEDKKKEKGKLCIKQAITTKNQRTKQ